MPIPFLNSITLNKNEIQEFKVYNLTPDPTLTSAGDYGYMWLNTSDSPKTLKWWDGTSIRSIVDSGNTSTLTVGTANDLSGGVAGSLPYQQAAGDTTFLGIGTADQVLTVNSGATAPQWLSQSSLSVGSATNKTGGNLGDILVQSGSGTTSFLNAGTAGQVITSNGASPQYVNQSTLSVGSATTATTATNVAGGANGSILVQSGAGTTSQLAIGASGYILTSNGTTPGWSASIPSTSVSGLAASATTDTTNASNISSGTLGLARLSLASGQFYVGDGSNNPAATAKSSIPLSGFGAAGADVAMGGFKITGLGTPTASTDAATMGYVDSVAQGLDVKASCLVATTTNIDLANPGAITIDNVYSATFFTVGVTRILVKNQSAAAENGIYIWQGPSSAMTRSADANTWDELIGAFTFIENVNTSPQPTNENSGWVCTAEVGGTLGSTAVTWVKFSQAGSYTQGRGMVLDGTAFNFAQNTDYAVGDLPYATGQTTIGLLPAVATGNALISGGVTTAPSWGKIGLTTHVSGTLPIANGGTGATSFTQGQVLFAGASTISSSANLFWDNSNNRLGIGTATPRFALDANGDIAIPLNSKVYAYYATATNYASFGANNSGNIEFTTGTSSPAVRQTIAADGVCTWSNVGGVAGTAMLLSGDGLKIGTGSGFNSSRLVVADASPKTSSGQSITLGTATGGANDFQLIVARTSNTTGCYYFQTVEQGVGYKNLVFQPDGGNVGIGTATPGAKLDILGGAIRINNSASGSAVNDGILLDNSAGASPNNYLPAINWNTGTLTWATIDGLRAGGGGYGGTIRISTMDSANSNTERLRIASDGVCTWSNVGGVVSNAMVLNGTGLGVGIAPVTSKVHVAFGDSGTAGLREANSLKIENTNTTANNLTGLFLSQAGDAGCGIAAIATSRTGGSRTSDLALYSYTQATSANPIERVRIKSTGQVNFVGLASDPAGAAGDVYYNSTAKALKLYATDWKTLPRKAVVQGGAGTGTTIAVAHNLNTNNVSVTVLRTTDNVVVFTDVAITDADTVTITFASSVTKADYTITVIG